MKKALFALLLSALILIMAAPALAASTDNFPDMREADFWSYSALTAAVDNGLLSGRSDGSLDPGGYLTRAELAAIVNRAFGAVETAALSGYLDVPAGSWYALDMAKAVKMRVFEGSGALLRPEDRITREETFVVLARAIGLTGGGHDAGLLAARYRDAASVSPWALQAICAMADGGYIRGSGGMLYPRQNITREEFAQVMSNLFAQYITAPGVYTAVTPGNILIRCAGVTLSGVTVGGDLILGDGLQTGSVTLNRVQVGGRTVVRGGGVNTVHIDGGAYSGGIHIIQTPAGGTRIVVKNADGTELYVGDVPAGEEIIVTGKIAALYIEGENAAVTLQDADVETLRIDGAGSKVTVDKDSTVDTLEINASGVDVAVAGSVDRVEISDGAEDVNVETTGKGRIGSEDEESRPKLTGSMISGLTFRVDYSSGPQNYPAAGNTSTINLGAVSDPTSVTIISGQITASFSGKSNTTLTFHPGYGSGFKLNTTYTLAEFLGAGTEYTGSSFTVAGFKTLLRDEEGDNKTNWEALSGENWPSAITYETPDATSATVNGYITASGYSGSVPYTLVLTW